jgi:hypothetical protein
MIKLDVILPGIDELRHIELVDVPRRGDGLVLLDVDPNTTHCVDQVIWYSAPPSVVLVLR